MEKLEEIAQKFAISEDTVKQLFFGLQSTDGKQVQFNIQELGGLGQWQINGMIMVGDMFNSTLKAKVNSICIEIAQYYQSISAIINDNSANRSNATLKGSQNEISYAYYLSENILEIIIDGKIKKYNTKGYELLGAQQSQGNQGQFLSFIHSNGHIDFRDLEELEKY